MRADAGLADAGEGFEGFELGKAFGDVFAVAGVDGDAAGLVDVAAVNLRAHAVVLVFEEGLDAAGCVLGGCRGWIDVDFAGWSGGKQVGRLWCRKELFGILCPVDRIRRCRLQDWFALFPARLLCRLDGSCPGRLWR